MDAAIVCRIEGSWTQWPTWLTPTWIAGHAQTIRHRLRGTALALSVASLEALRGGELATACWRVLRGMSRDRIRFFADRYQSQMLQPRLHSPISELLTHASARGERIVLLSDNLQWVMAPLAASLGIASSDVVAAGLEFRDGIATGALLASPAAELRHADDWVSWARERRIDLSASRVLSTRSEDRTALAGICAVQGSPFASRSSS